MEMMWRSISSKFLNNQKRTDKQVIQSKTLEKQKLKKNETEEDRKRARDYQIKQNMAKKQKLLEEE